MAEYSQKWHNGSSSRTRSTETFDGLAAIQAQLNNLRREIKKVNEKVYAAQGPYAVSGMQHRSLFSETVPFSGRLQNFACDDWREAQDVKILDAYDHTLPQKEKDLGRFTLPCFIHNICFDKALVDLGASDKDEGKSHAETLIDIPVFVGRCSIISGFTIIDDDDMTNNYEEDLAETMVWYILKRTRVKLI
ncbi:hypothetical protein Tco_1418750 [Tanacetum coccineum]